MVDAFAAGDGGAVFGVVDKVIETGQDPRRFTEDLLRRLRDLVIVDAVPEATASGLIDVSEDQGERLVAQAARFGSTDLSRAADIVATGLTEMRGATAPRLLLELICARVLLPGADHTALGLGARLDRLERRLDISGTPRGRARAHPLRRARSRAGPRPPSPAGHAASRRPTARAGVAASRRAPPHGRPAPEAPPRRARSPPPSRHAAPEPAAARRPAALSLVDVRRLWPDIVEATKVRRRMAWIHLSQNCQVVGLEGDDADARASPTPGARDSFVSSGCPDVVREAAIDVVGADWTIDTIVDPGAQPGAVADAPVTVAQRDRARRARPRRRRRRRRRAEPEPAAAPEQPAPAPRAARNAAREAIKDTRPAGAEATGSDDLRSAPTPMPTATTSSSTRSRSVPRTCWPASSGPR